MDKYIEIIKRISKELNIEMKQLSKDFVIMLKKIQKLGLFLDTNSVIMIMQ